MRSTLLLLSFFIEDTLYFRFHIFPVRLHDLNDLTHRKLVALFDPAQTVPDLSDNSEIGILFHIRIAVIDLCCLIRFSKEESCRKLAVRTIGDLLQIPRHILFI